MGTPANLRPGHVTLSTWVNFSSSPTIQFLGGYGDTGSGGYWLGLISDYFIFSVGTGGGAGGYQQITSTATAGTAQWYHVAGTYDGVTQKLFVNGKKVSTATTVSGNLTYASLVDGFLLGQTEYHVPTRYLDGYLDDVAVWSEALTEDEVALIYARQSTKYSGTIASRVMDALETGMSWTTFSWVPTLPFLKELPDYASGAIQNESSSDYSALVGSTGAVGDNNLMSGIVGLWHLNEASGTSGAGSVRDDSGQGNHLTPQGGLTFGGTGRLASSATFNGTNASLQLPNTILGNQNTTGMTYTAWVRPDNYSDLSIVGGSPSGSYSFFASGGIWLNNGYPTMTVYDPIGLTYRDASSALRVPQNTWSHIVGSYNTVSREIYLYVNGELTATTSAANCTQGMAMAFIGRNSKDDAGDGLRNWFEGSIDEVGIWSRALHANEVKQLYRRGSNRIKYQVRACTAAACSDDATGANWKGPDGTNQTYFSELNNNTIALDGSGAVKKNLPSMLFSAFTNPVGTSRYFQFRMILESDDTGSSCNYGTGATRCSPELKSVTVDPSHYDSSAPSIIGKNGVSYYSLSSFSASLGTGGCASGVLYNLGVGPTSGTATWYW